MQIQRARPPTEQVHSSAAQLACARAGQQKIHAAPPDQTMDLVEKFRQPLNFVDHHDLVTLGYFLRNATRIAAERKVSRAVEQVVDSRSRQRVAYQKRLAGLTRAQEEVGFLASRPARSSARGITGLSVDIVVIYHDKRRLSRQCPGVLNWACRLAARLQMDAGRRTSSLWAYRPDSPALATTVEPFSFPLAVLWRDTCHRFAQAVFAMSRTQGRYFSQTSQSQPSLLHPYGVPCQPPSRF